MDCVEWQHAYIQAWFNYLFICYNCLLLLSLYGFSLCKIDICTIQQERKTVILTYTKVSLKTQQKIT